MISSKVLAQTLLKISKSKNSEKAIKVFFEYLEKKNFLALLPQIKKHLKRKEEESSQTQTLIISTKHDLSSAEVKKIISLVGAKDNVVTEIIKDETIIGGFSATYQGNIYDGSLKNQITQLRTKLSN